MHILLIAFPLLFHYASALDVAFRLVSFSPNPPSVSINNGSPVLLDNYPQHPSAPYYTKNINAPATSFTYKYTVDGVTESFDRSFEQGATETHNDFFGRKDTLLKIPALPRAFPDKSWGRGWGLTPLFDDSYVPTIWLEGEQGQIDAVLTGNSKSTNLTVFGIFKDEVFTLPVTELNAADPKKINFGKKGFSLKFAKKEDIYGRDQLTFKPSVQDPTMLREKLYADLLDACGLPSTRMVHARVYANKTPVGLYLLSDNADTASFFKAEFHGQTGFKNYAAIGTAIKPYTTFTFIYNGPTRADYPEVGVSFLGTNPVSNPVQSLLDSVLAPLATIQPGSEDGVKNSLEMRLDLDGFLKTVALEWLAGHWRGVWGQATKFMLYEDPVLTQNNWYYISANAEQTFGLGLTSDVVPRNIISKKYSEYQVGAPRPLIQKLLLAKRYGDRFANVLTDIVKTTFNPAALKMRIDGTVARIRAEVEWDRTLTRLPGGLADLYEIGDFDLGLTATTERIVGPNGTASAGWGIESWVSGRAESVSSMFGFQLPQTVIPGPDPIVSAPTEDQLKGHLLEKRSNSNSVKNSLHGTERVVILLLVAVFIVRGW